jgi:tellurite resistance protein TerC
MSRLWFWDDATRLSQPHTLGSKTVIPRWLEIGSLAVMGVVIVADLLLAYRRPRIPSMRESAIWIGFYVVLALMFAALVLVVSGPDSSGQFVAGWLTEYSLSIDNLFVFVIIMSRFAVPRTLQQSLLLMGIVLALLLRGVFILLGVTLIDHFSWIFYLFGAFLLYTAVQQLLSGRKETEETESRAIRFLRRRIPIAQHYDGAALTTHRNGRRTLTPIIVVFLAIGTTDLLFALDSIPAIFGITQDAFIVFAANLFALMGLRQLYFLLGDLMTRLAYLSYGIALILVFIGAKLILHALHDNQVFFLNGGKPIEWAPDIDTFTSLAVIVLALMIAVGASLIKLRIEVTRATRATQDPS